MGRCIQVSQGREKRKSIMNLVSLSLSLLKHGVLSVFCTWLNTAATKWHLQPQSLHSCLGVLRFTNSYFPRRLRHKTRTKAENPGFLKRWFIASLSFNASIFQGTQREGRKRQYNLASGRWHDLLWWRMAAFMSDRIDSDGFCSLTPG